MADGSRKVKCDTSSLAITLRFVSESLSYFEPTILIEFLLVFSTLFISEILEISDFGTIKLSLSLLADNPLPTTTSAHINSRAESNKEGHYQIDVKLVVLSNQFTLTNVE